MSAKLVDYFECLSTHDEVLVPKEGGKKEKERKKRRKTLYNIRFIRATIHMETGPNLEQITFSCHLLAKAGQHLRLGEGGGGGRGWLKGQVHNMKSEKFCTRLHCQVSLLHNCIFLPSTLLKVKNLVSLTRFIFCA